MSERDYTVGGIEQGVREVLCECLGVPADEIHNQSALIDDLAAESMDYPDMALAIGHKFSIYVPDLEAEQWKTVNDIIASVVELLLKNQEER